MDQEPPGGWSQNWNSGEPEPQAAEPVKVTPVPAAWGEDGEELRAVVEQVEPGAGLGVRGRERAGLYPDPGPAGGLEPELELGRARAAGSGAGEGDPGPSRLG